MPNRNTLIFIIFLSFIALLSGWNYFFKPFAQPAGGVLPSPVAQVQPSPSPAISPTANFTTRQKILQLLAVSAILDNNPASAISLPATTNLASPSAAVGAETLSSGGYPATLDWALTNSPGMVVIFGQELNQQTVAQALLPFKSSDSFYKPLIAVDHEGGSVQRLSGQGFSQLPSWQELCHQDASISATLTRNSGRELKDVGVDVVFAPVLDLGSPNSVFKTRICDQNPKVVAAASSLFMQSMSDSDVWPVMKHFPGIGQTKYDLHQRFDSVTVTATQAAVFAQVLNQFPTHGVMVSHVGVTNQFADKPCSLSAACVGELVANYPRALVISDDISMPAAGYSPTGEVKSINTRVVEAISAGVDVVVISQPNQPAQLEELLATLVAEYQSNPQFKSRVDASVEKVVNLKMSLHTTN
jgi:beta-N-acetylhexosaminidase